MTVYSNADGIPGIELVEITAVIPLTDDNGTITLALNPPMTLTTGTYWLSVNANMDFVGPPEQWFWQTRIIQTGSPYHWRQTGVFGPSCVDAWEPGASVCGVGGGADLDLIFRLQGTNLRTGCDLPSALPWIAAHPMSVRYHSCQPKFGGRCAL